MCSLCGTKCRIKYKFNLSTNIKINPEYHNSSKPCRFFTLHLTLHFASLHLHFPAFYFASSLLSQNEKRELFGNFQRGKNFLAETHTSPCMLHLPFIFLFLLILNFLLTNVSFSKRINAFYRSIFSKFRNL